MLPEPHPPRRARGASATAPGCSRRPDAAGRPARRFQIFAALPRISFTLRARRQRSHSQRLIPIALYSRNQDFAPTGNKSPPGAVAYATNDAVRLPRQEFFIIRLENDHGIAREQAFSIRVSVHSGGTRAGRRMRPTARLA